MKSIAYTEGLRSFMVTIKIYNAKITLGIKHACFYKAQWSYCIFLHPFNIHVSSIP